MQGILRRHFEDRESVADRFGRYITTPKYQQPGSNDVQGLETEHQVEELKKHLSEGCLLVRNEGSRFAFEKTGHNNILFVDGALFGTAEELNELVETLCTEIELSPKIAPQTKAV